MQGVALVAGMLELLAWGVNGNRGPLLLAETRMGLTFRGKRSVL